MNLLCFRSAISYFKGGSFSRQTGWVLFPPPDRRILRRTRPLDTGDSFSNKLCFVMLASLHKIRQFEMQFSAGGTAQTTELKPTRHTARTNTMPKPCIVSRQQNTADGTKRSILIFNFEMFSTLAPHNSIPFRNNHPRLSPISTQSKRRAASTNGKALLCMRTSNRKDE